MTDEVANARKALLDAFVAIHPDEETKLTARQEMNELLDRYEEVVYQIFIEEFSKAADFDFVKHRISLRYGISVDEVTPEFLEEKMREMKDENDEEMERYAKEHGIELQEDTPEFRAEIQRKYDMIRNRKP